MNSITLFPPNAFRFGGGGGAPSYQPSPPDIPTATPPVSATSPAVTEVQQNLRRQQLRRKTLFSTIKAGATGGYQPPGGGTGTGTGVNNGMAAAPSVATGITKTGA